MMDQAELTEICRALESIPTPTLSSQLIKQGLRLTTIRSAGRLVGDGRIAGPAFTIHFIPAREDLTPPESYGWPDALPAAIDAAPSGSVVVMGANGHPTAGTAGDIFAKSLKLRGIRGIVTDGAVRDLPGLVQVGLPIWGSGTSVPPSIGGLSYAGHSLPIGCGDTAVLPGDIIVADADGAVVVPPAVAKAVAEGGRKQDLFETWVLSRLEDGRKLVGLYPANEATLAEYEASQGKV